MTTSSRPIERGAPRVRQTGPIAWSKKHLFNSVFNSVLTVVLVVVIAYVLYSLLSWAFVQAPWAVVTDNFAQYLVGLYPPEFYWRAWAIFAVVLTLAGVSWGILARNQKQLFSPPVLIGFGIAAVLLVLLPMTRPYLIYSLGSLALLALGAIAGQAIARKSSKAPQLISAGWFLSYFVVLYLLGGNSFTASLLYTVLFQVGLGLLAGWLLSSRVNAGTAVQWLGRLALLAVGFALGYYVLGNVLFPILVSGLGLSYSIFLVLMAALGVLLGVAMVLTFSETQTLEGVGKAALFIIGFLAVYALMGWLPAQLGLEFGFERVRTTSWGGLMLTLFLAVSGIALCFPAGVLLALGRQSKLPLIRLFSVSYIELVRGVPLISILFMGQVLIPLFLPEGMRPDPVVRAIIGLTIFSAAYLAENVRAGLQSIPQGQSEAAQSLGLNKPLTMALIVLPQALKTAIPAIVGQFISLFQDTTLLGIVGLLELLGMTRSLLADPNYLGDYAPAYVFIGAIYWIFCYGMSYGSRRVEAALNTDLR